MLDNYRWHYDYVRLAWDTGFQFDQYKHPNVDENKISLVDIDRIVKERDVALVERYISIVIQFILDHDQAKVLDTNFVKMFRMGQLAVEYLLFCKKYLDNTTVLLKKDIYKLKEQIKELKSFNEELEAHIATLTKQNLIATFKCDKCLKVFSTEQYLNSHLKRRHSEDDQIVLASKCLETDQLHLEIKELKQRLNETEKLLKEKNEVESDKLHTDKTDTSEIRQNFERFKEHIEIEIANLQAEKKSYEQKYNEMFEFVLKNREEKIVRDFNDHRNQTTQTENFKELQIESTHNMNVIDIEAIEQKEDVNEKIERKLSAFGEAIELKITSGLVTIEQQMHIFLKKLQDLESNRIENTKHQISLPEVLKDNQVVANESEVIKEQTLLHDLNSYNNQEVEHEPTKQFSNYYQQASKKPRVKPRTKFSKPTFMSNTMKDDTQAQKIKAELDRIMFQDKQTPKVKVVQSKAKQEIPESESETVSNSSDSSISVKKPTVMKKVPKSNQKFSKKIDSIKLRREICDTMHTKLQDLGISNKWKGIPNKTFTRALEIVQHQSTLTKKVHRNFDSLKKSIERAVEKDIGITMSKQAVASDKNKTLTNVIKIHYVNKKKGKIKQNNLEPVVTIKNRSLYDTDSDSEYKPPEKQNIKNKFTMDSKISQSHAIKQSENTDSDLNSIILSNDEKVGIQTKSALKSYASDGSLTKKKVIFDIDGESQEKLVNENNTKVDSLSDFDLSVK